ncbi:MAG: YidC/Oxa1 family membrane protein insertase [Armatimonadetes bacterium]|nr:YidC/Oxa1 family membrane protein insertase [Armatimonadota bacterium]
MKSRLAACLALLTLTAAFLIAPIIPARGQDASAPPPAFAVAQRLQTEAQAAANYAQALDAKDLGNANIQRDIAHRRALQATLKYREVVGSAAYGRGPWGAEALFQEAQVQHQFLHDDNGAIQSLQTLHNNYHGVAFPSAPLAAATLTRLETAVDQANRTTPPGSYLYKIIDFFVQLFGGQKFSYSYALAILAISVLVRLALTPLSNKQFASMREMQKLQPYVKEIQAKYKNDKETQMRKTQELYKEHNVNMFGGCGPMLVQLPILIGLYRMIVLYQYQFVHGKFFWVGSALSAQFPQVFAPNLGQQDVLLLVLYTASMYVTQKLTVTPSIDPAQAEQQRQMAVMMPLFSGFLFYQWHLPSAFVLYYLVFNILSTAQQKYYMKQHHADIHGEPDVDKDADDTGGGPRRKPLLPTEPASGGAAKDLPRANGAANGSGGRRALPGRDVPLAQAKNQTPADGVKSNGATPAAKGVIAPRKVHPKKKRR